MINAVFRKAFKGFRISGHSGYSSEGSDIVCAAVSAMTMLTVNTAVEGFGARADVKTFENDASVEFLLLEDDENAKRLITGLHRELCALAAEYPHNLRVTAEE